MSFKDILSKLDQLSEGDVKHTGTYGNSYGKEDVRDQYGQRIGKIDKGAEAKKDAPKKGRGRPKKGADDSGEVKSYDTKSLGSVFGGGQKPKGQVGKVSKKHSLKEYFDQIDKELNEGALDAVRGRMQTGQGGALNNIRGNMQQSGAGMPSVQRTGQAVQQRLGAMAGKPVGEAEQVTMEPAKQNTQVIKQGTKTLGTVANPQLAAQIKQSIGKGEMSLAGDQLGEEDVGKHNNATTGFAALVKKLTPKYGAEAAKRIAGAQLKKIKEADLPPNDGLMGAGLGAGRSQGVAEGRAKADNKAEKAGKKVTKDLEYDMYHKGKDDNKAEKAGKKVTKDIEYDEKHKTNEDKKPDANKNGIPDYAEDGKGKNDLKKKKVKEGMDHKLKAAHHAGKSHALSKQGYNCSYDDMEESRCYHEGYKEGLDECYGQMPIQGSVVAGEGAMGTVDDMASFGAHTPEVEEGNAFTAALKKTPQGGKFSLGGKSFTDNSNIEEVNSMFESWDNQLGSLLEEYQEIQEGMTVSISKGQQGQPDSVSVSAQDSEADQLLNIIKQAGLGLFGGEEQSHAGHSSAMSLQPSDGGPEGATEIGVVGDHDGMMDLIKKVTGGAPETPKQGFDNSDEDSEDEEQVDEVESEDQQEFQVAEDNPPDTGAAEFQAMDQEVAADNAAASSHGGAENSNLEEEEEQCDECGMMESDCECDHDHEEKVEESYANADDDTFEADIDFMTKIISGGLNKQKSTGQTTIPVIAGQNDREGYSVQESIVSDWKKLAGLK